MSRYPWPPRDFVCLYEHNCPYLKGLSTTWVLGEYRRAADVYQKHLRIIDRFSEALDASQKRVRVLERENAELLAKYQALHRKQFKANCKKKGDSGIVEKKIAGSGLEMTYYVCYSQNLWHVHFV